MIFSPYFIEDNIWKIHSFTNLLRRSIIWPIYNYCRFTETQKHQVYTCNIQQHQHNHAHWLAEFFNLSFDVCTDYVWDMPFVLVISYISVTQSFISLRILRMSNFMLQVAISSLHIYFFTRSPWLDCVRIVRFCFLFINFFLNQNSNTHRYMEKHTWILIDFSLQEGGVFSCLSFCGHI